MCRKIFSGNHTLVSLLEDKRALVGTLVWDTLVLGSTYGIRNQQRG